MGDRRSRAPARSSSFARPSLLWPPSRSTVHTARETRTLLMPPLNGVMLQRQSSPLLRSTSAVSTSSVPACSAAHLPPRTPVTATVATAAATSLQRVRLDERRACAPAGRSSSSLLPGQRPRYHGCCFLFAAGTVRQAIPATAAAPAMHRRRRRQQHSRRSLTSLPPRRYPPPLPRLPLCSGYG